jgi:NAD/NADP transhydrogenase beta subunit
MENNMEITETKNLDQSLLAFKDLEKRINNAGDSLQSAGKQFIQGIVVSILTVLLILFMLKNSDSVNIDNIIIVSTIGSICSIILTIRAIIEINNSGDYLKSKKKK